MAISLEGKIYPRLKKHDQTDLRSKDAVANVSGAKAERGKIQERKK